MEEEVPDVWVWKSSTTGMFSVKEAYNWQLEQKVSQWNEARWRWIWRLNVSANIQFFLWQLCHRSIPAMSVLKDRGIAPSDICPVCETESETISHCLFSCDRVWNRCFNQLVIPLSDNMETFYTWSLLPVPCAGLSHCATRLIQLNVRNTSSWMTLKIIKNLNLWCKIENLGRQGQRSMTARSRVKTPRDQGLTKRTTP